jgi:hypothetical protein
MKDDYSVRYFVYGTDPGRTMEWKVSRTELHAGAAFTARHGHGEVDGLGSLIWYRPSLVNLGCDILNDGRI